jgi:hypothetical protein
MKKGPHKISTMAITSRIGQRFGKTSNLALA